MTKHDLKELAAMGAELGAAKAENEKLRGLLREVIACQAAHYGDATDLHLAMITLADRLKGAISQQADPAETTETFTAVDMATAAAQGFRDGQAAVEQAAVQNEREAFEASAADDSFGNLRALGAEAERRGLEDGDYIDFAARKAWEYFQAGAAWQRTRPAQTAPQGKFRMGDLVKKSTGSEWQGRICGTYSTALTPEGYAVESEAHAGSVQIYPAKALELVPMAAKEA